MLRIEDYFNYYWARDLNYAMKSDEDNRFISELPKEIRVNVYLSCFIYFIDLQEFSISSLIIQI
jgi:hypothetical protein